MIPLSLQTTIQKCNSNVCTSTLKSFSTVSSDSMVKTELFLLMVSSAVCYVELQMSVCALLQDFSLLRVHFCGTTVLFYGTHAYESQWKY